MSKVTSNLLVNCTLLVVVTVLSLTMLEFGIRWLYPAYDPSGRVEYQCTEGAFTGPKNAVLRQFTNTGEFDHPTHFNAYGFRDQRDLGQSTARDIFVVGDSFSYGQGVEQGQRYSDLLDGLRPEQVFNISIPNNIDPRPHAQAEAVVKYVDADVVV